MTFHAKQHSPNRARPLPLCAKRKRSPTLPLPSKQEPSKSPDRHVPRPLNSLHADHDFAVRRFVSPDRHAQPSARDESNDQGL